MRRRVCWRRAAVCFCGVGVTRTTERGDTYQPWAGRVLGWTAPRHRVPVLGCQQPTPEPSVSQIKRIGIDTSKAVFTLHAVDEAGQAVLRVNLRRAQMVPFFRKRPATESALAACGTTHPQRRRAVARGRAEPVVPGR